MDSKTFSYEQVVCAALANYQSNLLDEEIIDLIKRVISDLGWTYASDVVRFSNEFVTYESPVKMFRKGINLESPMLFEGISVSLNDYIKIISGNELCEYIASLKESQKRS